MPELPEIANRARQIKAELTGKTIAGGEILQPKCLNLPPDDFLRFVTGATILDAVYHGKWILVETSQGWILINEGMGGELLLVDRSRLPEKYRILLDFTDGSTLAINFWWFGSVHYMAPGSLASHEPTARLGPNAIDLDAAALENILHGQKGKIKAFLLEQSRIAGIGNAYIHDILFLAGLHPLRPIPSLTREEIFRLAGAIQQGLRPSLEKGGAFYEVDLHGKKGGFTGEDIIIGYREGEPCPTCKTPIEKIKTGGTSSFICPHCQPL